MTQDAHCTVCGVGPLYASESDDLGRCASCAMEDRPILTGASITDEQIQALTPHADEWFEANGRRLRMSWWIFNALHSHSDEIKARDRQVCADFINARAKGLVTA